MKIFYVGIIYLFLLTIAPKYNLYSTGTQTFIYKTDKFVLKLMINRGFHKTAVNDFLYAVDTCLPYIIGMDSSLYNLSVFYDISLFNDSPNKWIIEINTDSSNLYKKYDTLNLIDVFEKKIFPLINLKPKKISKVNIYKLRFKKSFTIDDIHKDDIKNLYIYSSLQDFTMYMEGDFGCHLLWGTPATKSKYYLEIGLFRTKDEAIKASETVVESPNDVEIISMNIVCNDFHKLFQYKL